MKKIFCFVLIMIMSLCSGCTAAQDVIEKEIMNLEQGKAENATELLEQYIFELENFEEPISEYGERTSKLIMDEKLVARIIYPSGDIEGLDEVVKNWIDETVAICKEDVLENDGAAELTVEYSSYKVDDKFVSIRMAGVFQSPSNAHPIDIIATFNGNEETKSVLNLEEILLPDGYAKLQNLVAKTAGVEETEVNEHILDNWILKEEGVEITLPRGVFLPMSEGTRTLLFSYDELKDIVDLSLSSKVEEPVQEPENEAVEPEVQKPKIALTFDDGPSQHTERLLDIFAKYGGKGTFFVVGNQIDNRAETVKRTAAEGHEIGNHSWSHRQLTNLSKQEMTDQIMSTKAKVYEVTGVDMNLIRPTYGASNDSLKALANELGCSLVNWSVDTEDWRTKNADAVYNAIMKDAKEGAIILCHDLHGTTVDAMERVIPDLIAQGYDLVTVTELLTSDGDEMVPGQMYYKN